MKKLFALLSLFCAMNAIAQTEITRVYLDSVFKETKSREHAFYRVMLQDEEDYILRIFYKSGKLMRQGRCLTAEGHKLHGTVRSFWETGGRMEQLQYENGTQVGGIQTWHENGKPQMVGYLGPVQWQRQTNVSQFWTEDGIQTVKDGVGHYKAKGLFCEEEGEILNEKRTGKWTGTDFLQKLKYVEIYKSDGILESGESVDKNGMSYKYTEIVERPTLVGGIEKFYEFVKKTFRTPDATPGGRILLKFTVDTDGDIADLIISNCSHPPTQQAIINMMAKCPKWVPGKKRGKITPTDFTLPLILAASY